MKYDLGDAIDEREAKVEEGNARCSDAFELGFH